LAVILAVFATHAQDTEDFYFCLRVRYIVAFAMIDILLFLRLFSVAF